MVQVTLDEITHDPQTYLDLVEAGQTLVILKAGKPMAEIKPLASGPKTPRPFGLCAGAFTVPDDFDASWEELTQLGREIGQSWQSDQTGAEILETMRR